MRGLSRRIASNGGGAPKQAKPLTAAALAWGDVELRGDGSGRVNVATSKTDQGSTLYLGKAAARALRKIRPADVDPAARLFGLTSGRSVSNRLRAMAKAAGLGDGFTGHSPRVGMAQDLAAAGTELPALMVAGRWASPAMPARYARGELAGRGAVARYCGR